MQTYIKKPDSGHSPFDTHFEHLKIEVWNANRDEIIYFSECSTFAETCNTETPIGIEMRDGTVEHLPACGRNELAIGSDLSFLVLRSIIH